MINFVIRPPVSRANGRSEELYDEFQNRQDVYHTQTAYPLISSLLKSVLVRSTKTAFILGSTKLRREVYAVVSGKGCHLWCDHRLWLECSL